MDRILIYLCALCLFIAPAKAVRLSIQKQFRPGLNSHYVRVGEVLDTKEQPEIVFLPGFGVGTFHYERNMDSIVKKLSEQGINGLCYSMDWLGQAKSWPTDEKSHTGIRYCATTWCEQLEWFLENELNGRPVYLAGNSLGGFMAVQLAARRPELVKGLILINATPIWSFQAPMTPVTRFAMRPFGWTAELPAPAPLRALGAGVFNMMRKEEVVQGMLSAVYADPSTIDTSLVEGIKEGASNPLGPDAFTSIMFAPKMTFSFEDQLLKIPPKLPCLLLYGAEDPWVVPFWGDRTYRRLAHRGGGPSTDYTTQYYLSPCGHCAHHEASSLVNQLVSDWVNLQEVGVEGGEGLMDSYEAVSEHSTKGTVIKADRTFGCYQRDLFAKVASLFDFSFRVGQRVDPVKSDVSISM